MKRALDLKGQRFGRLVALNPAGKDHWKKTLWVCRCDCGNRSKVRTQQLRDGKSTSCGCLTRERTSAARLRAAQDLTGETFGILTIVGREGRDAKGSTLWRGNCACGGEWIGKAGSIVIGERFSCGCLAAHGIKLNARGSRTPRESA